MLSVTRYNPGRYPPGPRFPQFGDAQFGDAVGAIEEARGKLAAKRQGMAQFHLDRLQQDGFMPVHSLTHIRVPDMPVHNPQQEGVEAFDRPAHLPMHENDNFESASEATISPPHSPRGAVSVLEPLGRVARAGFNRATEHMSSALQHNVEGTVSLAKKGAKVAGQVVSAVGNASHRAASASTSRVVAMGSASASAAAAALEPGSTIRRNIAGAAETAGGALSNVAKGAHNAASAAMEPGSNTRRTIAEGAHNLATTVGPPIVYGAGLAGQGVKTVGSAAAQGVKVAGSAAVQGVTRGLKTGLVMATQALSAASLSAVDIIKSLNELKGEEGYSAYNALENGHMDAIGYGPARRSRADSPSTGRNKKPRNATTAPAKPNHEHSYSSTAEWLKYSQNRGTLVEELYKRPNWRELIKHTNTPELRKKLQSMSPSDLAEILITLDSM